ncbi:MAG: phosphoribosylformylglycinamidine synthase [Eubacteriaceae bacterium]|nr:phosphoribosylformylglycinamidine synthase [Eubacteriaceae bacterium]
MIREIRRVFVEKKDEFNVEGKHLLKEFSDTLSIAGLRDVRVINRYDISLDDFASFEMIKNTVLSEPNVDNVYEKNLVTNQDEMVIPVEYLPGQYDQRADWASQSIRIITHGAEVKLKVARIIVLKGAVSSEGYEEIKKYLINPVDSREASLDMPLTLEDEKVEASDIAIIEGFITLNSVELEKLRSVKGFAMSSQDIVFVQKYFKDTEKRDPSITELKVIDTYWSDHCRHTTFLTEINSVEIQNGHYAHDIKKVYDHYLDTRKFLYPNQNRPLTLMDLATANMKLEKKIGNLKDLDESEEINACSINIDVDVDGKDEKWLLMFKNETHNHPTEIEPFGGAATCLGGAIRDPLSGRSYVYQSMRVTGAADPRKPVKETIKGKLPQRKITREAARGFSSYGNQIGLATGQVTEIYHEGYVAKRMEIGAVIGAAPKANVVREVPKPGDVILLIGGRTGRDGCGGATGSSKSHTEDSILTCGAEVQKGNPPEERKIQRLFRNPEVSRMIKRCNDFGAGGVSVAIGELAQSLEIDLDQVPKKYDGLDGTELAISESQERMAVVIAPEDVDAFLKHVNEENIEGTQVAKVTDTGRLVMKWRGRKILDLSREFLDTNGAKQYCDVYVSEPENHSYFDHDHEEINSVKDKWIDTLTDLNICSQKGLSEMFDSTIGAGTVVMPFGGKFMITPPEGMAAKIPVQKGETNTCSLMTFGYQPEIFEWSPFHGGIYSILEASAKMTALGGDPAKIRFSLQEYFERLQDDPQRWGKPFAALLGAFYAQKELGLAAIGGKDSMSGSFNDIDVPPTLTAFAVTSDKTDNVITPEFKNAGSPVYRISIRKTITDIPDFDGLKKIYSTVKKLIDKKMIISAKALVKGGVAEAISKMSFGNRIGFVFDGNINKEELFKKDIGSLVVELTPDSKLNMELEFPDADIKYLGKTSQEASITYKDIILDLVELQELWEKPLRDIFPEKEEEKVEAGELLWTAGNHIKSKIKFARPKVFIPVFPGTNCEYDSARAFERAGADVETFVFKNLTAADIESSLEGIIKGIKNSQIIMFPGGFSAGDEPDGSGKFIGTIFRNGYVKDAVMEFLNERDGLILGICNGFQALIKLGLLPFGDVREIQEDYPTLTFNSIGRHISRMAETKVVSNLSPWFNNVQVGDEFVVPLSHGEGRFIADDRTLAELSKNGQIATQYVDLSGKPASDGDSNPNGSYWAIEGITSPDGRILGKMGHSERIGNGLYKNIPGEKDQRIFESGVEYFG